MSSIAVTPTLVPLKELQQLYNKGSFNFRVRRGARVPDFTRLNARIEYDRLPFNYQVALVAPPIVLQERAARTDACNTRLGRLFLNATWQETVAGGKCENPYECDEELLNSSTALLACGRYSNITYATLNDNHSHGYYILTNLLCGLGHH